MSKEKDGGVVLASVRHFLLMTERTPSLCDTLATFALGWGTERIY